CLIRLCGNSSSGHHDVAWLDVAVNKAHRMSVIKGFRDRGYNLSRGPKRQSPRLQKFTKRQSVDETGNQYRDAFNGADLIEPNDTWVLQAGGRTGLAQESFRIVTVGKQADMRNLDCHQTLQFRVPGLPDGPCRAMAEIIEQLELTEGMMIVHCRGWGAALESKQAAAFRANNLVHPGRGQWQGLVAMGAAQQLLGAKG